MTQQHIRVLQGFTRQSDNQLISIAGAVVQGMTGNKAFPAPPVDPALCPRLRHRASASTSFRRLTSAGPPDLRSVFSLLRPK